MARPTARVGWNNRSQTVTMPLEFRFPLSVREVFVRRDGDSVVLTPRPPDWSAFLASGLRASADFMADAERLPVQERSY
jgi:antitoxin VapB